MRHFDHLDLRVNDRQKAQEFYRRIGPLIGFPHEDDSGEWLCYGSVPWTGIGEYLAITEDRSHQPSRICHALWAQSKDEVDRIAAGLRAVGVPALEGPDMFYRGHYAVYFEDPSGNRFEVCHREYTHGFDPRIPDGKP